MRIKKPNAFVQSNSSPEHAQFILEELRKQGLTFEMIAVRTGLHPRSVFRIQKYGITKFPLQHLLECMAGLRDG